jgi:hypothetical protein
VFGSGDDVETYSGGSSSPQLMVVVMRWRMMEKMEKRPWVRPENGHND